MADADVITALFALGILEPAGGKSSSGVTGDDAKEGEKLDDGQARGGGFPFKASDTADLRAVGVQVRRCNLSSRRKGTQSHFGTTSKYWIYTGFSSMYLSISLSISSPVLALVITLHWNMTQCHQYTISPTTHWQVVK